MTAATATLAGLDALLDAWPLSPAEHRQLHALINDVLVDAYEESGIELDFDTWQRLLPASLLRVLVELVAPIADHPHAEGLELEMTRRTLAALTTRLAG